MSFARTVNRSATSPASFAAMSLRSGSEVFGLHELFVIDSDTMPCNSGAVKIMFLQSVIIDIIWILSVSSGTSLKSR